MEASRLEELQLACLEDRIEADIALGRHADVVAELEALVARHPLRERLRGQLMLSLYRSGRQAEALAAYREFRATIDEQLGLEPSLGLRELERRILQQDPALGAPAHETPFTPPAAAQAPHPEPTSTARRGSSAAATCRSPIRCSATAPWTSCSCTAGCAASTPAGSASRSRASTAGSPRWAG